MQAPRCDCLRVTRGRSPKTLGYTGHKLCSSYCMSGICALHIALHVGNEEGIGFRQGKVYCLGWSNRFLCSVLLEYISCGLVA
jgi:hypothetical protein